MSLAERKSPYAGAGDDVFSVDCADRPLLTVVVGSACAGDDVVDLSGPRVGDLEGKAVGGPVVADGRKPVVAGVSNASPDVTDAGVLGEAEECAAKRVVVVAEGCFVGRQAQFGCVRVISSDVGGRSDREVQIISQRKISGIGRASCRERVSKQV